MQGSHTQKSPCHARMREVLSYLHIPKTTSMYYIYEATIVIKILIAKTTQKGINVTMSYCFPLPLQYEIDYVLYKTLLVCKTKYRWVFF